MFCPSKEISLNLAVCVVSFNRKKKVKMENFEELSNDQIRARLQKFGLPVIPVTDTTRKTLIKRLVNAAKNGVPTVDAKPTAKSRRETVNVARNLPTDESDSDLDVKKVSKIKQASNRRATIAAAAAVPTPAPVPVSIPPVVARKSVERKLTPLIQTRPQFVHVMENSDDEIAPPQPRRTSRTSRSPSLGKSAVVTTSYKHTIAPLVEQDDPEAINLVNEEESESELNGAGLRSFNDFSAPLSYDSNRRSTQVHSALPGRRQEHMNEAISTENSVFKRRFTTYTPSVAPKPIEKEDRDPLADVQTPFLSDFARRLAELKAQPLPGISANLQNYKASSTGPPSTYRAEREEREYRSYSSRPTLSTQDRFSHYRGTSLQQQSRWKEIERKVRWPIIALLVVFACVFTYVFLFTN